MPKENNSKLIYKIFKALNIIWLNNDIFTKGIYISKNYLDVLKSKQNVIYLFTININVNTQIIPILNIRV